MKFVLSLVYLLSVVSAYSADKKEDVYLLVSAVYHPSIDVTFKKKILDSGFVCYPIIYKKERFLEEAVKEAFEKYLLAKDEEGTVDSFQVQVFTDQKEAVLAYQALLMNKDEKYEKSSFSRAHIEKVRDQIESEKDKPVAVIETVKKDSSQKAIDDIYE